MKQRHTAKRIFERLKEEHGFTGGSTIVKDYVRSTELHRREVFIPLMHAPGEAHADFGKALVVIAGVEQKPHAVPWPCKFMLGTHFPGLDYEITRARYELVMGLAHADDCFVKAFLAETGRILRRSCAHIRKLRGGRHGFSTTTRRSLLHRY